MKQRDTLGRYTKVYRKASRWEVLTLYSVLGGILFAICFDVITRPHVFEVVRQAEASQEVEIVPEVVMIEVTYNWTEERIIEEINNVFPDAPIMVKVAKCESSLKPDAYNPTNNSHDKGLFQISGKYHGAKVKELGLDMYDVKDNLAFARILYDEQGLKPWIWSKSCWNK